MYGRYIKTFNQPAPIYAWGRKCQGNFCPFPAENSRDNSFISNEIGHHQPVQPADARPLGPRPWNQARKASNRSHLHKGRDSPVKSQKSARRHPRPCPPKPPFPNRGLPQQRTRRHSPIQPRFSRRFRDTPENIVSIILHIPTMISPRQEQRPQPRRPPNPRQLTVSSALNLDSIVASAGRNRPRPPLHGGRIRLNIVLIIVKEVRLTAPGNNFGRAATLRPSRDFPADSIDLKRTNSLQDSSRL